MRAAFLAVVLLASVASARDLEPGIHMVPIQGGEAVLMSDDGVVATNPTTLPAGYWLSMTGYERLQGRLSTLTIAERTEKARAEGCLVASSVVPRVANPNGLLLAGVAVISLSLGVVLGVAIARGGPQSTTAPAH